MTTKIKTTLLTVFFLFALLTGLQAQDNYEYAMVKYINPLYTTRGLYVSISGKEFEKIEVKKEQLKEAGNDYSPVLNYIQTMADKGWRVINTFIEGDVLLFVLERKRN